MSHDPYNQQQFPQQQFPPQSSPNYPHQHQSHQQYHQQGDDYSYNTTTRRNTTYRQQDHHGQHGQQQQSPINTTLQQQQQQQQTTPLPTAAKTPPPTLLKTLHSTIAKLQYFHNGNQDVFLNALAISLQLLSAFIQKTTNVNNPTAIAAANISTHINSSRFVLRFLTGIKSIHQLIQDRDILLKFYSTHLQPKMFTTTKKMDATKWASVVHHHDDEEETPDITYVLRYLQSALNLCYNCCELPAYLDSVGQVPFVDGAKYSRYSCIVWCAISIIELIITLIDFTKQRMSRQEFALRLLPITSDILLSSNWSVEAKYQFLSNGAMLSAGMISAYVQFFGVWFSLSEEGTLLSDEDQQHA